MFGIFKRSAQFNGVAVLCYHGVVERRKDVLLERNLHQVDEFSAHIDYLSPAHDLTLPELQQLIAAGRVSTEPTVIFTFDDGYRNNINAWKALASTGNSLTIFVTTGSLGPDKTIWTVELSLLLLHGEARELKAGGREWKLHDREHRKQAFEKIRAWLKKLPASAKNNTLETIRAQFPPNETIRLLRQFPSLQMLSWDEIKQLSDAGVHIGSHGVHHEIHHAHQDRNVRVRELIESKKEIESKTGKPCTAFAFPNGDVCDDSPREASEAGYSLAFTTRNGRIQADSNRFLLPRISPGKSLSSLKRLLLEAQERVSA